MSHVVHKELLTTQDKVKFKCLQVRWHACVGVGSVCLDKTLTLLCTAVVLLSLQANKARICPFLPVICLYYLQPVLTEPL